MNIKTVLQKCGVAGQLVVGYIELFSHKKVDIIKVYVKLILNTTVYSHFETQHVVHEYEAPNVTPKYHATQNDNYEICIFECPCFNERKIKEYYPGTHRIPFHFSVPQDFQPVLILNDNRLSSTYVVVPSIVTPSGIFYGNPTDFPIIYNDPPLPLPLTKKTLKEIDGIFIEVTQSKQVFYQGEPIIFDLHIKSFQSPIPQIKVVLNGVYAQNTVVYKQQFLTLTFEQSYDSYTTTVSMPLPFTIPPSVTTQIISWKYFISVQPLLAKKKVPTTFGSSHQLEACFPVTILAHIPNNSKDIEEYCSSIKKKLISKEFTSLDPPPFPSNSSNGLESVVTTNGTVMYLDHNNRIMLEMIDNELKPSKSSYPFYESTTLPLGYSYGLYKNREYIIDHNEKKTYWPFQFNREIKTQAENANFIQSCVSIHIIEARGLNCLDEKTPPTVYCCVVNESNKKLKTKPVKGLDPTFKDASFYIKPSIHKRNVVVYLYHKKLIKGKELIGLIDIDLTKFPFHSFIEAWFPIRASPYGKETYTGKVRMKVGYETNKLDLNQPCHWIEEVWSNSIDLYYPSTREMVEQVKKQNKLRKKLMEPILYEVLDNNVVKPFGYYLGQ
ncbi:Arrestin C-terminal-like domain-containing protein [Entamoeba marina]